jgi:DNA repair protein RecN (Recombination protein N)
MLRRLDIENYGLIARAEVEFAPGATIFTGETGSGKTMLLGALNFVLGERAGADVVRRGGPKAVVTLTFDPGDALRERLIADGLDLDADEEATIVREMTDAGRSNVRVNGRPSTAGYVRALGADIVEIVGQHEAQRLLAPAYHLESLDRFAGQGATDARTAVAAAHARALELQAELATLHADERGALREYEDARTTVAEIDGAKAEPGEDDRLDARRRLLDDAERVTAALSAARDALDGEETGASIDLGAAAVALTGIATVGESFKTMGEEAASLQSQAGDLAARVARELESIQFDPNELETINARLAALDRLKQRYGGSLQTALDQAERARRTIEAYDLRDERNTELEQRVAAARIDLITAAATLTAERTRAASDLRTRIQTELADIALASARFDATLTALDEPGPHGAEKIDFVFAANPGEPPRALARTASGGELSRVLLALIVVLAASRDAAEPVALVFDEIDAGIGGATATAVGVRIGRLARAGQVLCITHHAQLATWADRHYVLDKTERAGETAITAREISTPSDRESELARMLSGETHQAALTHARTLLEARHKR